MSRFGFLPVVGGWKVYFTSGHFPPVVEACLMRDYDFALMVVDCWLECCDWGRYPNAEIREVLGWREAVGRVIAFSYAGRVCSARSIEALVERLGWREPDGWCEVPEQWVDAEVWRYLEEQEVQIRGWFQEVLDEDAVLGN